MSHIRDSLLTAIVARWLITREPVDPNSPEVFEVSQCTPSEVWIYLDAHIEAGRLERVSGGKVTPTTRGVARTLVIR